MAQDRVHHLLDDLRRQSFRWLVEQHQRWIAHQGPSDRQHLLLASAHASARAVAHLGEIGKQREQLVRRPVRRVRSLRLTTDLEILVHREVGEDAPLLRHIAEPVADNLVSGLVRHIPALERDAAAALLNQANDRAEGRGFAGAVAPQQGHDFAGADGEFDVKEDVGRPVMAVEPLDRELHAEAPSW